MPLPEADKIDWDDLRLCLAVARAGTLSAAGEALGLSHSTLLRRVSAMEKRLGVTLFSRSSNGYTPNAAGKSVIAAASAIEAQIHDTVADVHGRDRSMAGVIRFAVPDLSGQALMDIVRLFVDAHPDVEIIFDASQKPSGLTLGDCHIALALTAEPPAGQVGNPIGSVGFAAYINEDVANERDSGLLAWVGLSPSLHHLPVARFNDQFKGRYKRQHICNSVAMQYAAIRRGLGIGVLACAIGDADRKLVRCSPVFTDDSLTLWLMHRKELRRNARITAFHRHLLRHLQIGRPLIQGELPAHPPLQLLSGG